MYAFLFIIATFDSPNTEPGGAFSVTVPETGHSLHTSHIHTGYGYSNPLLQLYIRDRCPTSSCRHPQNSQDQVTSLWTTSNQCPKLFCLLTEWKTLITTYIPIWVTWGERREHVTHKNFMHCELHWPCLHSCNHAMVKHYKMSQHSESWEEILLPSQISICNR